MKGYCEICGAEIDVKMCCSGHECGCAGLPVEPPVCSEKCYDEFMNRPKPKKGELEAFSERGPVMPTTLAMKKYLCTEATVHEDGQLGVFNFILEAKDKDEALLLAQAILANEEFDLEPDGLPDGGQANPELIIDYYLGSLDSYDSYLLEVEELSNITEIKELTRATNSSILDLAEELRKRA